MTKTENDEFIKEYLRKNTKSSIVPAILWAAIFLGVVALMSWIVQTAFGYFGYDFTLWQSFIIAMAVDILFGKGVGVNFK